MGEEMLYGVHAVVGALRNKQRRVSRVLVDERRRDAPARQIATLTGQRGIPVETVSRAELNRASDIPGIKGWPLSSNRWNTVRLETCVKASKPPRALRQFWSLMA